MVNNFWETGDFKIPSTNCSKVCVQEQIYTIYCLFNLLLEANPRLPGEDFRIGETYFHSKLLEIFKVVQDTTGGQQKLSSPFKRINRGPFYGRTVIDLLYENHIVPVLQDYFPLAGAKWENEKEAFEDIIKCWEEG